jgi:hypothetical protein
LLTSCVAAKPTADQGPFGLAVPTEVHFVSRTGRWMVLFQAREDTNHDGQLTLFHALHGFGGDQARSYLFESPGLGEEIERLLAVDLGGRFVAFVEGRRLFLLDTQTRVRVDLSERGAAFSRDGDTSPGALVEMSVGPRRFDVVFSRDSHRGAYIRRKDERRVAVVRELDSGAEIEVDPGPGQLDRIAFEGSGSDWLVLYLDGWPSPERRLARLTTARVEDAPTAVPFGSGLLRTEMDGSLWIYPERGDPVRIGSADCRARVLFADERRELVVGQCSLGVMASHVVLLSRGPAVDTGIVASMATQVSSRLANPRFLQVAGYTVWSGAGPSQFKGGVIDLERRLTLADVRLWGQTGDRALIGRATNPAGPGACPNYELLEGDTGKIHPIGICGEYPRKDVSPFVLVNGTTLVDVQTGAIGHFGGLVVDIDERGRGLGLAGDEASPQGPASWVSAKFR